MDKTKLLEIIGALFVELETKRSELEKSKEEERKSIENTVFWMDRCKEKDVKISELEAKNAELQALVSGLNEFIAKGRAEVTE